MTRNLGSWPTCPFCHKKINGTSKFLAHKKEKHPREWALERAHVTRDLATKQRDRMKTDLQAFHEVCTFVEDSSCRGAVEGILWEWIKLEERKYGVFKKDTESHIQTLDRLIKEAEADATKAQATIDLLSTKEGV